MNNLPKFVFSRSLKQVAWDSWGTVRLDSEGAATAVRKMQQEPGRDMVVFGSFTLVSALMKAVLIGAVLESRPNVLLEERAFHPSRNYGSIRGPRLAI